MDCKAVLYLPFLYIAFKHESGTALSESLLCFVSDMFCRRERRTALPCMRKFVRSSRTCGKMETCRVLNQDPPMHGSTHGFTHGSMHGRRVGQKCIYVFFRTWTICLKNKKRKEVRGALGTYKGSWVCTRHLGHVQGTWVIMWCLAYIWPLSMYKGTWVCTTHVRYIPGTLYMYKVPSVHTRHVV